MTVRRLLNADALFTLVLGLVLLLNGLLGPRFPFGAPLASLLGVALLVAAMFLGQGGMGKGPLTSRLRTVGLVNLAASASLVAYAVGALDGAARNFVLVVSVCAAVIGGAQALGARAPDDRSPATARRRASAEELRIAIGREPTSSDRPPRSDEPPAP